MRILLRRRLLPDPADVRLGDGPVEPRLVAQDGSSVDLSVPVPRAVGFTVDPFGIVGALQIVTLGVDRPVRRALRSSTRPEQRSLHSGGAEPDRNRRGARILRPLTDRRRNQVWGVGALLDELDDLGVRIAARIWDLGRASGAPGSAPSR